jgi:succinoglycan biosynthesis protein ExoO
MIAADQTFLRQHTLDRKARAAQRRRARSLVDARSFLLLIDGIKQRSVPGILGAAWRNPRALRHLKLPIGARLRRFSKRFTRSSKSVAAVAASDISNLGGGPHSSKG